MDVRSLGYRTDLMVRRLAGSEITERRGYLVVRTPQNPAFYWGNFLLYPTVSAEGFPEQWIEAFAREFPGATHLAFGVDSTDHSQPLDLGATGIGIERDVVLTAVVLQRPDPPGDRWRLRALRSDDDWSSALDLRLEVNGGDGPLPADHRPFLERSTEEARNLVESGHGAYFGAFSDDRLCSMAGIVSDGRAVARFQNVATRVADRGRGLARNLVVQAGEFGLAELGARTLVIVADAEGPAADLYRSVGFQDAEQRVGLCRPAPA